MYMGIVNTGYAGSFFIPTIINELGYSAAAAQVRSIPIFIVATIVSLIVAWVTDMVRHRFAFCILGLVIASVGYIILLCQENLSVGPKYFASFLITPGGFITQPIILAWVQNCMSGHYKRSITAAMTVGFGNIGGIIAANVFFDSEKPRYTTGYSVSLSLLWICAAGCLILFVGVIRENRRRNKGERDERLNWPDADNLGDDHPSFRFAT